MNTDSLTPTQLSVFKLLVEGPTNAEIAKQLLLGEKTVKAHVTAIFNKLGCDSRTRLIARYYQGKLAVFQAREAQSAEHTAALREAQKV